MGKLEFDAKMTTTALRSTARQFVKLAGGDKCGAFAAAAALQSHLHDVWTASMAAGSGMGQAQQDGAHRAWMHMEAVQRAVWMV